MLKERMWHWICLRVVFGFWFFLERESLQHGYKYKIWLLSECKTFQKETRDQGIGRHKWFPSDQVVVTCDFDFISQPAWIIMELLISTGFLTFMTMSVLDLFEISCF